MPIYNPANSADSYYDPWENTQQPQANVGQAIFNTAKTMAVFGALNVVGRMALGALSRKSAAFIGAYNKGKLGDLAKKSGTIGGILKNTSAGKQLRDIYSSSTRSFRQALSAKRSYVANVARTQGAHAARAAGFQRTFSDFKTFAGSVGSLWKREVLAGAGVAYAIDSFFGFTKEMGLQEKPIWDVPGQVGNFAKWLAMDSVFTLGFQGAAKAARVAGGGLKAGIGKVFGGAIGDSLTRHMIEPGMPTGFSRANIFKRGVTDVSRSNYSQHFVSKAIRGGMAISKSVPGAMAAFNNLVRQTSENVKSAMRRETTIGGRFKKGIADPTARALRQVKDIWKSNKEARKQYNPVDHPGLTALKFLDEMSSRAAMGGGSWTSTERSIKNLVEPMAAMARRLENKRTLVDDILPQLKPLRNRDVVSQGWVERVSGNLTKSAGYAEGSVKQLMDSVLNMKVGLNIYRPHGSNIRGGGVNLGFMDPVANIKRAIAAVLNKPWHVPFTGLDLSLGDIVGANIHLSDSPPIKYWKGSQHFRHTKDHASTSFAPFMRTTGDMAEEPWFTVYMDGKLGYVHSKGVDVLDWGRKLKFAAPNSTWKQYEHRAMNKARDAAIGADVNALKDRSGPQNSWLQSLVHRSNLQMPGVVNWLATKVNNALGGKDIRNKLLAQTFDSDNPDDWYKNSNILQSLRLHAGQDVIHILKDKEALKVIGDVNNASFFGDSYDMLINSRTLRQRLEDVEHQSLADGKDWARWLARRGIHNEVNLIKAYPNLAEGHVAVKKIGRFQEMNVYDRVRLEMIDDVFGNFWGDALSGSGREHPLINALPELQRRGLINDKQAKSLNIFGKLRAYMDTGVFGDGFRPKYDQAFSDTVKFARRRSSDLNWNLQRDILEFVQNEKMRAPSQRGVRDELIPDGRAKMYNRSAYTSVGGKPFDYIHDYASVVFDNVTNMLNSSIFPFKKDPSKHMDIRGNLRYVLGSSAKIAGAIYGFKVLDAAIAANPLLDNTAMENGLTGMIADGAAATRLVSSRFLDFMGVTGVAKHLNGLMPGFTTSAPGAIMGAVVSRTLGGGPLSMAKWFAGGAVANRMLAPFLPDFTKSYEQLEAEYNGETEVPIMKSPTWLLGATPWEGSKVIGYQPNWYVRTKSRWQESDTLYGSTFRRLLHEPVFPLGMSLGDFVDPYYMERKHYFSRPYPETGGWGKEIPLIGPLLAGTVGKIMKPPKTMHQEFLMGSDSQLANDTYQFSDPPPTLQEGWGMMRHSPGIRKMGGRSSLFGTFQYSAVKPWAHTAGEDFLYNVQNFAGMHGFLGGQIGERLMNEPQVLPTLETAGRIASQSRAYFDANLGGLGVFTEPVRRLMVKPEYKRHGINPIPNLMPNWLPEEFLQGDPYAKIIRGELRLPGEAYTSTHQDLRRTMPGRASMLGAPEEHMLQYFTGLLPPVLKEEYDIMRTGTTMHGMIQDSLAAEGLLVQAERLVIDAKNDITGHVDAIIKDGQGGRGRRALEIKTINEVGFEKLDGPKWAHTSQLNFYLKQLGLRKGTVLYINRDNPAQVKSFDINYSQTRWEKDLNKLQRARQVAADMMGQGIADSYGYSYSWLDRLDILADVAPMSKEFKEAKRIVQEQIKEGLLTEKEISKYKTSLSHRQTRMRKYELYPLRFRGKVFSPDTQKNIQSINEDIKAGADYSLPERAVGALWESFTNSNNFISNKFFAFKDPLEHYKMLRLYGREYKPWDEVWNSFAEPAARGMLAQTDPFGGAYKFGVTGFAVAGPIGATIGTMMGSAYGSVHGLFRAATNSTYIPKEVQERRRIEGYFDAAKHERFSRMAELSSGLTRQEYLDASNATLTAFNENGQSIANLFRGTPYMEKPYIESWLNTRNQKERDEILRYLPSQLGTALQRQWAKGDQKEGTQDYLDRSSAYLAAGAPRYAFDRSILDPSVELEDIKLKTVEQAGLDAHDFGLGWNQQLLRVQGNYNEIAAARVDAMTRDDVSGPEFSSSHIRYTIMEQIRQSGLTGSAQVYINNGANDINSINVVLRRDQSRAVIDAIKNRQRYLGG